MFDNINNISVAASSVGGNYNAENSLSIPVYNPKIIFYKKSPTEGILYNKAIKDNELFTDNEITIIAEPYYLPLIGNEDKFNYSWTVNGGPIATPSKKTELTVNPTSRGGYADLGIIIENANELFQKITGQLKISL